ncbi:C40 family peptidase [Paenirhodobacter sp.]|uniref:C40 family peptidase n=1 Tax=Paenirhodobacter sp. TaxID=1965326 RepID=UPI003B3E5A86
MSDRRLTPFSGRVMLDPSRQEPARIGLPVCDLCPEPGALRDRQVLFGAEVGVIDRRGGWAFVQARADGYCGWVVEPALSPPVPATHVVSAPATHVYREASIKRGEVMRLSLGARVAVTGAEGGFAVTPEGFIPAQHLRPLGQPETDPVAVAERLLGTPYLWGGNSRDGIDCSGLVQLALALCGRACPGDSDLQAAAFPRLPEGTRPERGDLLFWKGHVAMACDAERLIHANGHTMSVAHEGIAACHARIAAAGEGPFLGISRPGG